MQHETAPAGSNDLVRQVRARFTERGDSLRAWCVRNRVTQSYAYRALTGEKGGPSATALRERLISEATKPAA